jgi:hypothetical protein
MRIPSGLARMLVAVCMFAALFHMSNKYIGTQNPGVDSQMLQASFTWADKAERLFFHQPSL